MSNDKIREAFAKAFPREEAELAIFEHGAMDPLEAITGRRYWMVWMKAWQAALSASPTASECHCDMRTKLVGDGCAVCNPAYAADHAALTTFLKERCQLDQEWATLDAMKSTYLPNIKRIAELEAELAALRTRNLGKEVK